MKLNATSRRWPGNVSEAGKLHPFAHRDRVEGYKIIFSELEHWLAEITRDFQPRHTGSRTQGSG